MDQTYLIFGHRGARYGLPVRAVQEIVWLPELSPIEELPPHIAGVFNLRGRVVPVMDLCLRFGHPREPYRTFDRVVVIEDEDRRVGIIANELHDVLAIAPAAIEDARNYQGAGGQAQFVFGEAKLDDGLAMLLDVAALLCSSPAEEALAIDPSPATDEALARMFGRLSQQESDLFHSRARSLAEVHENVEGAALQTYAVIKLNDELFGLELDAVREFVHLRGIIPAPCCPPHIVGNMNLRGDILTLADIRPALGMAGGDAMSEAVVVHLGELCFGVPAQEIVDVVQFAPADIAPVPVAADATGKVYCKGIATVAGKTVGILDLKQILAARELQVAQGVQ